MRGEEEEGLEGRTLPPTLSRSSPKPGNRQLGAWRGSGSRGGAGVGSAPRPGARLGTWRAGCTSQAGGPGRGGCERARPSVPAQPRARLGGGSGELRLGSRQPQSCRQPSFVRRRHRRRRLSVPPAGGGDEEGEAKQDAEGRGGGASPLLPPAPTSRALRSAPLSACAGPPPPGRLAAARGRRSCSPSALPGAAEFKESAGRAAPPRCSREPPRRPSPAEEPSSARRERRRGESRRERASEPASQPASPGADTMPGWKKNIPICLQAEEQERGEWGAARGEAGPGIRAGPSPVPPETRCCRSWPTAAGEERRALGASVRVQVASRERGEAVEGGWSAGPRGRRAVPQRGTLRLGQDSGRTRVSPGPARTWSPGGRACGGHWGCRCAAPLCQEWGGGRAPALLKSDFSNFPAPPAAAFAASPPLAGLRWCCQAQSCRWFLQGACRWGKGTRPRVSGGGG